MGASLRERNADGRPIRMQQATDVWTAVRMQHHHVLQVVRAPYWMLDAGDSYSSLGKSG